MIDRYSNPEIARLWELEYKFQVWVEIELAVCEAWQRRGVISAEDLAAIQKGARFQLPRILEIEAEVQHDVIAFLTNLRENIGPAGRFVHYGLTSSDVGDTALCVQMMRSAQILEQRLQSLIEAVRLQAIRHKDQTMIGRTHGIHGEPTTLGLKFAYFYAELQRDLARLQRAREEISVGKLSGAVGTFSNIDPDVEAEVCAALGLKPDPISTQVINRDRHAMFMAVLGVIAGGLERMAQEIRLLQKSEGRELEEPFASGQKGSSAMPHKRNPVICERICGLARVIQSNVQAAYRDMPLWHERDISHSSAERVILPDSIIALEYILGKMHYVIANLHVYPENMQRVLNHTRGLLFSQKLLLRLIDLGLEREQAYQCVQSASMDVWADPGLTLRDRIQRDAVAGPLLDKTALDELFQIGPYLRNVDAIFHRLGLIQA
ncbi:MAG: adenylosuccinate lyase [Leptospirales bacterium]|nr:adenylosuccinate lyase [Leptospirales bacterium]